jgi:hypothetical protein
MTQSKESNLAIEVEANEVGRDFVGGDIHGNKNAFSKALDSVC